MIGLLSSQGLNELAGALALTGDLLLIKILSADRQFVSATDLRSERRLRLGNGQLLTIVGFSSTRTDAFHDTHTAVSKLREEFARIVQ